MRRRHVNVTASRRRAAEVVYELLADRSTWPAWSPIESVELERPGDPPPDGVGAIRVNKRGRITGRDQILELVPGRRFKYASLSGLPVRDYIGEVDLSPTPDGGTAVQLALVLLPQDAGNGMGATSAVFGSFSMHACRASPNTRRNRAMPNLDIRRAEIPRGRRYLARARAQHCGSLADRRRLGDLSSCSSERRSLAPTKHPNIVFLLTDDLDVHEMAYMPHVRQLLTDKGVTFSHYYVSDSLCCPSRTTILRGQYAHNTGVKSNGDLNGGFQTAYKLGIEKSTIGTWLRDAGYRTAYIGKYLNKYPATAKLTYVPPGWDLFASAVGGDPYSEYNYTLNQDSYVSTYGDKPNDYGTTVYVDKAEQFIRRTAGKSFFLYLNVYAPHQPATPAPQDDRDVPERARAADAELQRARCRQAQLAAATCRISAQAGSTISTRSTAIASGRCKRSTAASSV